MKRHVVVTVAALAAFALAAGGCSSRSPARSSTGTAPPSTQGSLDGCVQAGQASLVDLAGGHRAAVLGSGPTGVVLSNQSDQSLCGWLGFGRKLVARGFRVLLYDYGAAVETRPPTSPWPPPSCARSAPPGSCWSAPRRARRPRWSPRAGSSRPPPGW